jgi:hypothetical protein
LHGPEEAPTRAILIAQYQVCPVIIDGGVEAVLKVCAVIEETPSDFEIYCANRRVIVIALSVVNIVQYVFSCSSVVMAGTSITREFRSVFEVLLQL